MATYQNFTVAQKKLRDQIAAYAELTPDYYFDSSLTTGTGSGLSEANAFKTAAELNAVLASSGVATPSNAYAGKVLAFKRGTVITEQIKLAVHAPKERPFIITAYGSGELPTIDLSTPVTDWVETSAGSGIWSSASTPVGTPIWQKGYNGKYSRRYYPIRPGDAPVSEATAISELGAASAGRTSNVSGTLKVYIKALTLNPNDGNIVKPVKTLGADASNAGVGLYLIHHASNSIYRTSGNAIVTNLAVRHCLQSAMKIEFASTSSATYTRIGTKVIGCEIYSTGMSIQENSATVSATAGTTPPGDGILMTGINASLRAYKGRFAGNFGYDVGNNFIETSFTDRLIIEWNVSKDVLGHGVVEHWASNSNSITRYNYSDARDLAVNQSPLNNALFGKGLWNYAQDITSAGSVTPANNLNNTYAYNACIGGRGEQFMDSGAKGTKCYRNTFITAADYTTAPVVQINPTNAAATTSSCDFSDNVVLNTLNAATKIEYIRTGAPANAVLTGSNNRFGRTYNQAFGEEITGAATSDVFAINTGSITDYTTTAAFATAMAATGMTAQFGYVEGMSIDANGWPQLVSQLVGDLGTDIKPRRHIITGITGTTLTIPAYKDARVINAWTGNNVFNNGSAWDASGNTKLYKNGVLVLDAVVASDTSLTLSGAAIVSDVFEVIINHELDFGVDLNGDTVIAPHIGAFQGQPLLKAYNTTYEAGGSSSGSGGLLSSLLG
jgi:hypothetical protein